MIFSGYQGIGKSSLAGKYNCIDLESENFWIRRYTKTGEPMAKPDPDANSYTDRYAYWYIMYVQIAKHLSDQGYNVLISSHKSVREYMNDMGIDFYAVCPVLELKDAWCKKLADRFERDQLPKHRLAYENAVLKYDTNVNDMMREKNVILLQTMDYDLPTALRLTQDINHYNRVFKSF